MGFPSPAADYVESRLSLDEALIQKPAATYYMRAGETIYRSRILRMWRTGKKRGCLATTRVSVDLYQYLESSRTSSTMRVLVSLMTVR